MSEDSRHEDGAEPYSGGQRHSDSHDRSDREEHDCTMVTKGFCSQHGVNEERRAVDRNRFSDLSRDFKDYKRVNNGHVSNLCTFKNRALGVAFLGVLFITGGYAYTYTHIVGTDIRYQATIQRIEKVSDDAGTNKINIAVLVTQLSTTNERLREMIELIREDQRKYMGGVTP